MFFLWVTRGGGLPQAGQTQQSGEPDCRGPEAKPHPRDTPNTPIPGGAQCPDQDSLVHCYGINCQPHPPSTVNLTLRHCIGALQGQSVLGRPVKGYLGGGGTRTLGHVAHCSHVAFFHLSRGVRKCDLEVVGSIYPCARTCKVVCTLNHHAAQGMP